MPTMAAKVSTVEAVLARLGSRQHGVVTRAQLLDAGLTRHEIQHRRLLGALLSVHRGVYRVGHRAPSVEARYLAAVLACGEGARLSGRAAAYLLSLLKGPVPAPAVTAPGERRVPGVRVRRGRIDPRDRATHGGIPITAVPRTLIDLAADLSLDDLARACHEAGSATARRPRTSPPPSPAGRPTGPARRSSARSSTATRASPSADSRAGSSSFSASATCRCRGPTAPPAPTTSTAAGPSGRSS
jgi:hypothetical protein